MKKNKLLPTAFLFLLLGAQPLAAEEVLQWEMLENLPDGRSYNYSPTSIRTVSASIKEVYDGVASENGKDIRQLWIDCAEKKWAIGETKSWRNGEQVPSPNLSENGWVWHPMEGTLNTKLISLVCGEEKKGKEEKKP